MSEPGPWGQLLFIIHIPTLHASVRNSFMDDDDDVVNLVYLNLIYDFWIMQLI